ncbi:MAG: alanine/ornithine racemase family PLP-dependent enzyme [Gammaproteobacteria bacterium]|nr:alanine/ornithine racemase family PLP-dependent enzyme [Gammaproteobacteria bacterium]
MSEHSPRQRRTPRLEIYTGRIRSNAGAILELCFQHGVEVACVTKVVRAHPAVVCALLEAGATMLADSRLENLWALREMGVDVPLLLLRLPTLSRATEVVRVADLSLVSSLTTMEVLAQAARSEGCSHRGILMVDVGDLREGVWPDRVVEIVRLAKELSGFELVGLGCNLACFGGILPTPENASQLVALREICRQETGLELPLLSGGNSTSLSLLASGYLPFEINNLRIGESIMLGRNPSDRSPWPGTYQDAFVAVAEVIEVERKPSMPVGMRGQDAFGGREAFVDRGVRLRAICNLGRQDAVLDGLAPVESGVAILGGSSDHLILDVEEMSSRPQVGDELHFYPNYAALLALATSPYIYNSVVR